MHFDYLIVSHAKPRIGSYNVMEAYSCVLAKHTNKKVCFITPSQTNNLTLKKIKINENLWHVYLPLYNYHKHFNLQIVRMFCLMYILFFYSYKKVLASGFSQPQISIPCTLIKIFKNKKIFYLWDDIWGNGFGKQWNFFINYVFIILEKISFKFCDGLIVLSTFFEKLIYKLKFQKNVSKIYMPYQEIKIKNNNFFKLKLKKKYKLMKDCKLILCMGNSYFGTERILLDTIKYMKKKSVKFKFIIIGNFQITSSLTTFEKKLIKKNCIIPGYISNKKTFYNYLSSADLYILPMAVNKIEISRFPVRLYDYLHCDKVLVSNATGELNRIFKKFKIGILTKNSAKQFAEGIVKGLQISLKKKILYRNNKIKCIKNIFDEKIISTKLLNIFEKK